MKVTARYGKAEAGPGTGSSPADPPRRWIELTGELPMIEGTLIRLQVDRLPGDGDALRSGYGPPRPAPARTMSTSWWQAYLRRFDLEHPFRLIKQSLGWTPPKLRDPAAGERWTWLIIAAHTQLRLARPLAADHAGPGRSPPSRTGSPRRGSDVGSGTSALHLGSPGPCTQTHPAGGRDDHPTPRTGTLPPATTWARPSSATGPSPHDKSVQVKVL